MIMIKLSCANLVVIFGFIGKYYYKIKFVISFVFNYEFKKNAFRVCTGLMEPAFHLLTAEVYAEWVCDKCLQTKNIPLVKYKP